MWNLLQANRMVQTMDQSLGLSSKRMSLIASNLANIDTPGYRTKDFGFESALKEAIQGGSRDGNGLVKTHPLHLSGGAEGSLPPPSEPILPQSERNDGNDVNLDRENLLLARTQFNYQMASIFMSNSIRGTLTAIRDAGR